ncbi:UPF0149 family protein [Salinicola sp. DM10]|uniref:UPF0149 family protein n=1 Tax=Salinicola sp. DM10 TaxID=2815721 RepID=UPI001A8E135B|nr:UPF0149 family protein [Salinicola sp. DM10]MCE3027865.1 UPF0149 family protein [Salinicola sp. DM10]
MSIINEQLDFSTVANVFLAHGSLQSPAFFDGRLCAELALEDLSAERWLEEVSLALNVEQPESREDADVLLGWRRQTLDALAASELNFEPLLPDELCSLGERAQGLKEWVQGFTEVVNEVDGETYERWSSPLREALEDLGQLAAIEVEIDDDPENENDLFALTEHARMAAMLLYTEQHPGQPKVEQSDQDPSADAGANDDTPTLH